MATAPVTTSRRQPITATRISKGATAVPGGQFVEIRRHRGRAFIHRTCNSLYIRQIRVNLNNRHYHFKEAGNSGKAEKSFFEGKKIPGLAKE
jgi:hypothetical protein